MLTLDTMLKAMRQMLSYGEFKTGALDFLPSRVTGGHREEPSEGTTERREAGTPSGYVRRWDDNKGAYVYVQNK